MNQLGHGSFGSVTLTPDGHAKKKYYFDCQESALREVTISQLLFNEHIIPYVDQTYSPDEQSVTMHCAVGTLEGLIQSSYDYDKKFCDRTVRALTSAVAHMHLLGVIHRDIKPENVMVMKDATVRLTDFSMSKFECESDCHTPRCGTEFYMAPEMKTHNYNQAIDDWCVGVTLIELFTANDYDAENVHSTIKTVGTYDVHWEELLAGFHQEDPSKRLRCVDLSNDAKPKFCVAQSFFSPEQNHPIDVITGRLEIDDKYIPTISKLVNHLMTIKKCQMLEVAVCAACVILGYTTHEIDACFSVFRKYIIEYINAIRDQNPLAIYGCKINTDTVWKTPDVDPTMRSELYSDDETEAESDRSMSDSDSSDDSSTEPSEDDSSSDEEVSESTVNWSEYIQETADDDLKRMRRALRN
jgi:serine/threonine protein kinase